MELVDSTMSQLFSNKYSSAVITLFLVLYGGLAAPKLPKFVVQLFDNAIFRILVLSLIVYKGNRDPKFAIMIGVAFTVTLNVISKQKFLEGFDDDMEQFTDTDVASDDDLDSDDKEADSGDDLESDDDMESFTNTDNIENFPGHDSDNDEDDVEDDDTDDDADEDMESFSNTDY